MPYTPPTYKAEGFNCPLCNFYAHQLWYPVYYQMGYSRYEEFKKMELSLCVKCKDKLLWYDGKIVFPVVNNAPPAHPDTPPDVKRIYDEAKSIVSKSSRASAALLRTAVGILVDHVIGKNKNTLNHNIGYLVRE